MTDIVTESVKKIEELIEHSGCGEGGVQLDVDTKAIPCQYERGATMVAAFGGRSADFPTFDPLRARTKISFMYGAPLDTPATRGAAAAIVNVVLGFLCMIRVLHACEPSCHQACREGLVREIGAGRIHCIGEMGADRGFFSNRTDDPTGAEVILINGEGIVSDGTGDLIERERGRKRIVCVGPSTAGIARLHDIEHWCPYGKC